MNLDRALGIGDSGSGNLNLSLVLAGQSEVVSEQIKADVEPSGLAVLVGDGEDELVAGTHGPSVLESKNAVGGSSQSSSSVLRIERLDNHVGAHRSDVQSGLLRADDLSLAAGSDQLESGSSGLAVALAVGIADDAVELGFTQEVSSIQNLLNVSVLGDLVVGIVNSVDVIGVGALHGCSAGGSLADNHVQLGDSLVVLVIVQVSLDVDIAVLLDEAEVAQSDAVEVVALAVGDVENLVDNIIADGLEGLIADLDGAVGPLSIEPLFGEGGVGIELALFIVDILADAESLDVVVLLLGELIVLDQLAVGDDVEVEVGLVIDLLLLVRVGREDVRSAVRSSVLVPLTR